MVQVLSRAQAIGALSGGAFDITVQLLLWVQDSGSIIYRSRELAEIDRNVCGSWQLDLQHRTFAAGGTRSQRCQDLPLRVVGFG